MTREEHNRYQREWRAKNRERVKEYAKRTAARAYLASIDGDVEAAKAWMATHRAGQGWYPVAGYWRKDGNPVVILHNSKDTMPYCVQCAGNGHYFETAQEAITYMTTEWKMKEPP